MYFAHNFDVHFDHKLVVYIGIDIKYFDHNHVVYFSHRFVACLALGFVMHLVDDFGVDYVAH